jgi:excinuclease ABC subunit B
MDFILRSKFKPAGGQPQAIKKLTASLKKGNRFQTLLGVTGSGKTFTMANIIAKLNRPALVVAHNKTLAAQLAQELREFFPENKVEYFVSYYDYYQPEAYLPSSDTYIEKDASINKEIEKMRSATTASLLTRPDTIVVASVSCIYGLGNPQNYATYLIRLSQDQNLSADELKEKLVDIGYERKEDLPPGSFRARGGSLEVAAPFGDDFYRLDFLGKKLSKIRFFSSLERSDEKEVKEATIFPTRHFVVSPNDLEVALPLIQNEMAQRRRWFLGKKLYLEAERLERRVLSDLAMLREVGYTGGIENYSRFLTGRKAGEPPYTLLDYFPKNFITFIDESHVTLPQLRGMLGGDRSRKKNLIKYGFRLPSALDNRPLEFKEFLKKNQQIVFVSATPAVWEREKSQVIAEQIIRPTGLIDPALEVRKSSTQIKDLLLEIKKVPQEERVLVTTLTKKMAEDLSGYLKEQKIKACYLHSEIKTLERVRVLRDLRKGTYRVLVGVNLLREGLDLPEVSLIAILDADKEGFLRNETSLIQTIGRAARNINGRVILYGEKRTRSMLFAEQETKRRRALQLLYNKKHDITPKTIKKEIEKEFSKETAPEFSSIQEFSRLTEITDTEVYLKDKEKEMKQAAENLEFEKAVLIRDEIATLKKLTH